MSGRSATGAGRQWSGNPFPAQLPKSPLNYHQRNSEVCVMAKLVANLTEMDNGYIVQTWCPTLSCAMRVAGDILAVNPDAFGPPRVAHVTVECEADTILREVIDSG